MHLSPAEIRQSSVIWILVADGGHAQIYRYHQHKAIMPMHDSKREPYEEEMKRHELTPVPDMTFDAEKLGDFQVSSDGRGSKIGGARSGHNTCEPHLDIHDEVKQNIVTAIVDKLQIACENKAFDHLVIAAPAKILGALRLCLDSVVSSRVIAEIDKDFTKDKQNALLAHLQETLTKAHIR